MAAYERDTVTWLGALAGRGEDNLCGSGLPTRRIEAWKYSDLPARLPIHRKARARRVPRHFAGCSSRSVQERRP